MMRFIPATALGVALTALAASAAEAPIVPVGAGYPTAMPSSNYAGPVGETVVSPREVVGRRYGLMPLLRKGVFWKKNYGACESCEGEGLLARLGHGGLGHGGLGHAGQGGGGDPGFPGQGVPGVPQPGQPGLGMPGTLVFPYNPFTRSPRDYFMYEKK